MTWLNLDIRTLIILMVFGNLHAVLLMVFSRGDARSESGYRRFTTGKLLQTAAWSLLSLRGHVPDVLSAHVGNSFLIAGFALEALAFTTAVPTRRSWTPLILGLAALGIGAFWLLGTTPTRWVTLASAATVAIHGTIAACLLRGRQGSRLRLALGLAYSLFSLVLTARAIEAIVIADFTLLTQSLVQTFSFMTVFLLMVTGVIGFTLLLKERDHRLLQESERKFATLFRSSPEAMLLTRLEDGLILEVNDQFEKVAGYAPSEVVGRTTLELGIFSDPAARDVLLNHVGKGTCARDLEFRFVHKSGAGIIGLLSAEAVPLEGGQVIVTSVADITDRKGLEAERERMIAELRQALAEVKTLSGLLPICASCKKIRDDQGYWNQIEQYIQQHSGAEFTHGLCPDCVRIYFPDHPGGPREPKA